MHSTRISNCVHLLSLVNVSYTWERIRKYGCRFAEGIFFGYFKTSSLYLRQQFMFSSFNMRTISNLIVVDYSLYSFSYSCKHIRIHIPTKQKTSGISGENTPLTCNMYAFCGLTEQPFKLCLQCDVINSRHVMFIHTFIYKILSTHLNVHPFHIQPHSFLLFIISLRQ